MIQAQGLTKRYGPTTAIQDVTFEVQAGEILGFLGPNGAGKTTTMRILAGFFPASEGRARVAGFDVFEEPLEVKRRVGYMPEHPPLYGEMTVDAFLRFVATIKGVARSRIEARVQEVKERCGLVEEGTRLIKQLSRGYRQRVGLAQALIHEPEVLILDEPTAGLDPRQIIEARELIRGLGGDRTVILSTHILPEVSVTCERVIIINNGRIVAVDTPRNLTGQLGGGQRVQLEVSGITEELAAELFRVPGVRDVVPGEPVNGRAKLVVETDGREEVRHLLARRIVESGADLFQLNVEAMTLEQIFVKLTTEEATVDEAAEETVEDEAPQEDAP